MLEIAGSLIGGYAYYKLPSAVEQYAGLVDGCRKLLRESGGEFGHLYESLTIDWAAFNIAIPVPIPLPGSRGGPAINEQLGMSVETAKKINIGRVEHASKHVINMSESTDNSSMTVCVATIPRCFIDLSHNSSSAKNG
jgi:hypothetical protein